MEICFEIADSCVGNGLLFLLFLLTAGLVLFSALLMATGQFMGYKDKDLHDKKLSMIRMQWPKPYANLTALLNELPDKIKDMAKLNLYLDFVWMCFLYPLMICLGYYVWLFSNTCHSLALLTWCLPLCNWVFDIMENVKTLSVLRDPSRMDAALMGIFSLLKWITAAVYIAVLILLLVPVIMNHCHC